MTPPAQPDPSQPPTRPYVVGDSLGVGVQQANGLQGNSVVGRSPMEVLHTIAGTSPNDINGRQVILSTGASNNPDQLANIPQMLGALKLRGASGISVLGVGNSPTLAPLNARIQAMAEKAGATFVPLPDTPDGIHPTMTGYRGLGLGGGAPARGVQVASNTGTPGVPTTATDVGGGGVLPAAPPDTAPSAAPAAGGANGPQQTPNQVLQAALARLRAGGAGQPAPAPPTNDDGNVLSVDTLDGTQSLPNGTRYSVAGGPVQVKGPPAAPAIPNANPLLSHASAGQDTPPNVLAALGLPPGLPVGTPGSASSSGPPPGASPSASLVAPGQLPAPSVNPLLQTAMPPAPSTISPRQPGTFDAQGRPMGNGKPGTPLPGMGAPAAPLPGMVAPGAAAPAAPMTAPLGVSTPSSPMPGAPVPGAPAPGVGAAPPPAGTSPPVAAALPRPSAPSGTVFAQDGMQRYVTEGMPPGYALAVVPNGRGGYDRMAMPIPGAPGDYEVKDVGGVRSIIDKRTGATVQQYAIPDTRRNVTITTPDGVTQKDASGNVISFTPHGSRDIDTQTYKEDRSSAQQQAESAMLAQQQQGKLLEARQVLQGLPTGANGEARAAWANFADTYMSPDFAASFKSKLGLPDSVPAQEFGKLMTQSAGQQERQVAGARGGIQMMQLFKAANPGLEMQPTANRDILNMQLVATQADQDYAKGYIDHVNRNGAALRAQQPYTPASQFDQDWIAQRNPQIYLAATNAMNGKPFETWGKNLGPADIQRVRGIIANIDPSATVVGPGGRSFRVSAPQQGAP